MPNIQYAVQQICTMRWIAEHGERKAHQVHSRLFAFNREHADAMAEALNDISGNHKEYRDVVTHMEEYHTRERLPTTYEYVVVGMVRNSRGQAVWLDVSDLEMIACVFNTPTPKPARSKPGVHHVDD